MSFCDKSVPHPNIRLKEKLNHEFSKESEENVGWSNLGFSQEEGSWQARDGAMVATVNCAARGGAERGKLEGGW